MATGYVITEIGYEYNDEIYYQGESGGGTPVKVYLDKDKAQAELDRLNLESLVTCEIGEYAYDLEDIIDDMSAFEKIIKKYDKTEQVSVEDSYELGNWFAKHAPNFSQADKKKLLEIVSLEFYTLTEVEIDDSKLPPKEEKKASKFSNLE